MTINQIMQSIRLEERRKRMQTEKLQIASEVLETFLLQDQETKKFILGYMMGKQEERERKTSENPYEKKGA